MSLVPFNHSHLRRLSYIYTIISKTVGAEILYSQCPSGIERCRLENGTTSPPFVLAPTMSLSAWLTAIVGLVTVWYVFRYWGFALIARALGDISATRLSPFSARGVEWRDSEHAVLPTLRVEKADWCWGGMKSEEMGLIVLTIEGVSFRKREKEEKSGDKRKVGYQ